MCNLGFASIIVVALVTLASCQNSGLKGSAHTGGNPSAGGASAGGPGTGGVSGSGGVGGSVSANPDAGDAGLGAADGGGGTVASGGVGGTVGLGGASGAGGTVASGGSGGATALGGTGAAGPAGGAGISGSGGIVGDGSGSGGSSGAGGSGTMDATAGGQSGAGGVLGEGGVFGSGGIRDAFAPCDLYVASATPCVAAYSTVRALYRAYAGALYQVRRASDLSTTDILVEAASGLVDIAAQDSFCAGTTCTISVLYDQSPQANHLKKSPDTPFLKNANEASATAAKVTVKGHKAFGLYVNNPTANVGYRNNSARGLATGDQPEAIYMVVDGKVYSSGCCFDFGNAGTTGLDEGRATMEALYWGTSTWSSPGRAGSGPWVGADFGAGGIFECDGSQDACATPPNTGWAYVTGMLKGPSGNAFGLKAGNAQSFPLEVVWAGARPPGGSPMKKEGAIVLGTGGDGSHDGAGVFYEGAITSGNPPDSTDDAVQANIVSAGYGR